MLKNMKVTTKLVAILAAPVIVMLALGILNVRQRQAEAGEAQRVLELTNFVATTTDLLEQVQIEGLHSTRFSGSAATTAGAGDLRILEELTTQRQATDEAYATFRERVSEIDPGASSPLVRDAIDAMQERFDGLEGIRQSVREQSYDGLAIASSYGHLTEVLRDTVSKVSTSLDNPQLAKRMESVAHLAAMAVARNAVVTRLAVAVEVGFFPETLPKGLLQPQKTTGLSGPGVNIECAENPAASSPNNCLLYQEILDARGEFDNVSERFREASTQAGTTDAADLRAQGDDADFDDLVNRAVDEGGKDRNNLKGIAEPDRFTDASLKAIRGLSATTDHILLARDDPDSVASLAGSRANAAQQEALVYLIGIAVAIGAAGIITWSVGRSITVPLRRLTNAAYMLSNDRLPALVERLRSPEDDNHESLGATVAPIEIDSRDEIGQLADSFNQIQQVTVDVADEQSVLLRKGIGDIFINLARRNQTLLDRQIEFIDQLEANEEDPDQLDNLFKLDHLATRMRRNAESLLVLAGAEPPRRRGRPVALADVVRVAIGEVEDFARIQLLALDDATVGGNVAVDLAHLLSELMENATHFSPPDTMVEIVGHSSHTGYTISVSDQGIGMSPEQLDEANHQLARPPLVGLALSRSLGFIVIGRLAQRFGIAVQLTASASGGVTALVHLPADLVAYDGEEPASSGYGQAPAYGSNDPQDQSDTLVIDRDLSLVDERYDYQPTARSYEPQAPSYEPQAPSYERQAPSYEPQAPAYEPRPVDDRRDDEFERGIQRILGDDEGHGGGYGATAPAPLGRSAGPAGQLRPEPIQTVAEQIAAASRAEAQHAELTAAGLVRRTPKRRADGAASGGMPIAQPPRATTSSQRSPEEVRKMLSRYRSGLNKGRNSADPANADS